MSLTVVAAGSALALYLASRRSWAQGGLCDGTAAVETHANVHFAPNSFMEDLYFLAEGLRLGAAPCRTRLFTS